MTIDAVCDIVAEELDVDRTRVTADSGAATLPEWDSLGHLRVILAIEAATGRRFPTSDIPELASVRAIHEAIGGD